MLRGRIISLTCVRGLAIILASMTRNALCLTGLQYRQYTMDGYMVYLWWRGSQCLYVGRTQDGIYRVLNHHKIDVVDRVRDDDVLEFTPCNGPGEALMAERALQIKLKPLYCRPVGRKKK